MIYIIIQKYSLSQFLFDDLEDIKVLYIPKMKCENLWERVAKKLFSYVDKWFYRDIFNDSFKKSLMSIQSHDTLIVLLEDPYTLYGISRICSHVSNKICYLWNPIFSLSDYPCPARLLKRYKTISNRLCFIRKIGYKVATFDSVDATSYNIAFVPQFYRKRHTKIQNNDKSVKFFFCGREKGRSEMIEKYINLLEPLGHCEFIVIRDNQSDAINYFDYVKRVQQSSVLCEIVQNGQHGLTLRTLEALFYGKKLITNNTYIEKYDFYNPNNIFIINNQSTSADVAHFMAYEKTRLDDKIISHYDVYNWVKLLSEI